MSALADAEWLNPLIGLLQGVQLSLLRLLAWLGLVGSSHGQPAWPWALRLSGENLLIDLGQARRLALTLVVLALVALLLLAALAWRRRRWLLLATVPLLLVLAPWPQPEIVLVPAYPTSFHRSPTGFSAASIAQGHALYAKHCVGCHGVDGRGQGPLAASQPVWPPNLAGPLLWRRADGDLLWRMLHGTKDRHGTSTMPAFDRLADSEAWALIDFTKAQSAGQSLRATGVWSQPIGLPDVVVRCEGREPRPLSAWRGQRLRIVAAGSATAPLEDPRMVTMQLQASAVAALPRVAGCVIDSPAAWEAFALIAGTDRLAGTQLLADRDGWLRARSAPGAAGWSEDDLLCRTATGPGSTQDDPAPADGLSALIARMDAEPVRFLKGGFVH
ncbi:cytochrome c [Variovorax sp. J22P240]|uniref:c-type cytochrome n=1 Tax=Variovorax sp. J22P240 TaxID=3053514 RepID=UPI0025790257|nr:cytochrome c [Variovorax sp. J22P240]MDM0000348.1 cytochrome c [Variovorax sp. J22P240]